MRKLVIALLVGLPCVAVSFSQQPIPSPPAPPQQSKPDSQKPTPEDLDVVKITTNLVQIDAVITDKKGQRITDLRPDEIEMLEDGKSQKLTNFSYVTLDPRRGEVRPQPLDKNAPPAPPVKLRPEQVRRTIALVVDDLGLSFESAYYVRNSLKKFVDQQVQPDDLVAIIRTAGGVGALQQFTSDKRQLYAAVEKVKWNPLGRGGIGAFAPLGSEPARSKDDDELNSEADLNQFREDVFAAGTLGALSYVVRGLRDLPGRKSIVLFSQGFQLFNRNDPLANTRILYALRNLTDLANRAAVVIYTIDPRGLQTLGLTAADSTSNLTAQQVEQQLSDRRVAFMDSQDGLSYLSDRTGGLTFKNNNDIFGGLKKVIEDQEGYYLIGYRPDDSTFDRVRGRAQFHHISLKIKRAGKYNVRMRTGFYGVSDEARTAAAAQTPQRQLVGALLSPFTSSGVHLRLTSLFVNSEQGSAMRSLLHIDARDLEFTKEPDGMHKAVFDLIAIAFGDNGQVIEQFGYTQTVKIKEESFARALNNGFTYDLSIPIKKAGAYQLRTALRDQSSSRVGSATQFIQVPDIKKNKLQLSGLLIKGLPMEEYLKGAGLQPENDQNKSNVDPDALPNSSPAVRQFKTGMALVYGLAIYNAQIEKATGKPNLKVQVRVFKNGEQLFAGKEIPYDPSDQKDFKRLGASGGISLGTSMSPGEYVLQIIVTDMAKNKPQVASQWMDFEITQ
ncbi:MAG TPA: VWA domain-containing protein [Pyrinomonadaceae bacterium]|jgi:VWFA-related protein|nr:VWA domain-containing protein [Pyrinomonadaceae bacterium]